MFTLQQNNYWHMPINSDISEFLANRCGKFTTVIDYQFAK
jgi:hypothetical protein